MKFKFLSTIFVILICSVSGLAKANQITLDTSNVIGSSGAFDNRFLAKYVLDNQTGSITETEQNANDVNGGYWLQSVAPGANTVSWFTIDLGSAFNIDFIELFNTHNAQYFDRGTGDFRILASNSVNSGTGDFDGTAVQVIASTLQAAQNGTLNDDLVNQTYSVSNTNAFRYLQFHADSSSSANGNPNYEDYGLNEIRVFEVTTTVPEPSTLAIFALGIMGLASRRFKKKS
jgi:hypothetical protein